MKRSILTICLVALFAVPLQASITGVPLGTSAPPAVLGPYAMTGFPADPQPAGYTAVSSVASPLGGVVAFSSSMQHALTPGEWATWSHGYSGDVYYTGGGTSVTLTLPSGTGAFYLYAEPNPFQVYQITATAQDGTSISQMVDGDGGACGYGFYGCAISTIDVVCETDFAVGEFGIAQVPEPATICLLGLGASILLRRKRSA